MNVEIEVYRNEYELILNLNSFLKELTNELYELGEALSLGSPLCEFWTGNRVCLLGLSERAVGLG